MDAQEVAKAEATESKPDMAKYPYLAGLNPAQFNAVTADPSVPLQILAGPGSGKTRVLTCRVAYLVQHHGIFPHQITAVTFTNKAAAEMRKRLEVLLGPKVAGGLVLGTFHATCVKYLRRYASLIDLTNNFAIADADDCKKIMSGLLKVKAEQLEAARISLKDKAVLSEISKAKAKGESAEAMMLRAAREPSSSTSTLAPIAELYGEYQAALRDSNSLDFDDLLVYGLRLFTENPKILESCHHILVDEFQDTNVIQYELMRCFAKAHNGVSIVGDPDQSVYGWRSAEIENLNRMARDFPGVQAIYLEENYRSTGKILNAAHSIIKQDRDRPQKSLYTAHPQSTTVNLKVFSTPVIEASFIATEIKRLIAYSGDVLNYGDFAILLRYNALSRVIESALQKDSIPNRIVGGHKFFERMEIKDLLAYLQLAENPDFTPAFVRVVNVPKRAIGDKSVLDIIAAAKAQKISPMELCERMVDGDRLPEGIKPAMKNKLAAFVGVVRKSRRAARRGDSVADLLRLIIDKTGYEEYLKTSQQDWESRWENVQELISFSVTVAEEQVRQATADEGNPTFTPASSAALEAIAMKPETGEAEPRLHPMFRRMSTDSSNHSRSTSAVPESKPKRKRKASAKSGPSNGDVVEVLSSDEEPTVLQRKRRPAIKHEESDLTPMEEITDPMVSTDAASSLTPLSFFLQTSMLSTDTDSDKKEDKAAVPKVTITTVHAAKGLEWPVVFIPAVEQGTYPSYRCTEAHEIAEERRLLYVAMTRAQVFLTMSHCQYRMMGGEENDKQLSEFVSLSLKADANAFTGDLPDIDAEGRENISRMLGRAAPDEAGMKDRIMKHVRAAPPLSTWDPPEPRDKNFNRFARREVTKAARAAEYWASEADDYALPGMSNLGGPTGFRSAKYSSFESRQPRDRDGERDRLNAPANVNRSPIKPVVVLKSNNHHFPEMPKFSFGQAEPEKKEAVLGSFTMASNSSLAMMKSLGLPGPDPGGIGTGGGLASPGLGPNSPRSGGSSPRFGSGFGAKLPLPGASRADGVNARASDVGGFQARAASGLAGLKSLGMPDLPPTEVQSTGQPKLAGGTKRLGMGRPQPWGTKKARAE